MGRGLVGLLLVSLAALLLVGGCHRQAAPTGAAAQAPQAEQLVDQLVKGDYQAAARRFDEKLQASLSPDKLQDAWNGVLAQAGDFRKRERTRAAQEQGFDTVYVTCQFARGPLNVKVVFDDAHQVSGLWFVPATG